jgi:hypothetical protein
MRVAAEAAVLAARSIAHIWWRVVMALKSPSSVCGLRSRNKVKPALTRRSEAKFLAERANGNQAANRSAMLLFLALNAVRPAIVRRNAAPETP